MARKPRTVDKNVTDVNEQNIDIVNSENEEAVFEADSIVNTQFKIKKTFNVKLFPYVRQPISCENSQVKITNLGFGDVVELKSMEILFTGDIRVFDHDVVLESTSFPKVKIEVID